jgi:hypothetical protein
LSLELIKQDFDDGGDAYVVSCDDVYDDAQA